MSRRSSKTFKHLRWLRKSLRDLAIVVASYLLLSYGAVPMIWQHYEHQPAFSQMPKTTESVIGLPGDPLNIALVGTKDEVIAALKAAGWEPADNLTIRTGLSTATSILLNRPYGTAPISRLLLWGRKQDLAFERIQTKSPRQRHHVRFWLSPMENRDGRPVWIGGATFDTGIGFNHFTGQLTHHISPDVDAEREELMNDLIAAGQLKQISQVTGVGASIAGRNAGGDLYYTDGELSIGILSPGNVRLSTLPETLPNSPAVDWKNQGWVFLRGLLGA